MKKVIKLLFIILSLILFSRYFNIQNIHSKYDFKYDNNDTYESYEIGDLDKLLNDDSENEINIKINNNVLTKEDLDKIKNSKKIVNFNYYDNNLLLYSLIIDGSKLENTYDFNLNIKNDSNYFDKIEKLIDSENYFYIHFNDDMLNGMSIKLYIKDYYKDTELLDIYYYDSFRNKLNKIKSNVNPLDGYIEFQLDEAKDYLIESNSTEENLDINMSEEGISTITTIATVIIIGAIIVVRIIKYAKQSNTSL